MAEPTEPRSAEGAPPQETDAIFKMQMAASDLVLGYWKHFLGGILVLLVASFAWSVVKSWRASQAEDVYGRIGKIDYLMPPATERTPFGEMPADDAAVPGRLEDIATGAGKYEEIAREASGAAGVEAWLKAAEAWRRAGKPDAARAALEKAVAVEAPGIVHFTAQAALANALDAAGERDKAMGLYKDIAAAGAGFEGETALLRLASMQADGGEADAARATLNEFRTRFGSSTQLEDAAAIEKRLAPAVAAPAAGTTTTPAAPIEPTAAPAAAPSGTGG